MTEPRRKTERRSGRRRGRVVRRRRVGVDEDVEAEVAGDVIVDSISWRSLGVRDRGMFWK
jgi:hypothetical protein